MVLHHDGLERRASARLTVRNLLTRHRHALEFWPSERLGLVSGRIRHWVKKAFKKLALCNINDEFDLEVYDTNHDQTLMARYNARREESGMASIDRSAARVREAVHEATIKRSHE